MLLNEREEHLSHTIFNTSLPIGGKMIVLIFGNPADLSAYDVIKYGVRAHHNIQISLYTWLDIAREHVLHLYPKPHKVQEAGSLAP